MKTEIDNKIYLSELVTKRYPHPDAPEDAFIDLLCWDHAIETKDQIIAGALDVQEKMIKASNQLILQDVTNKQGAI